MHTLSKATVEITHTMCTHLKLVAMFVMISVLDTIIIKLIRAHTVAAALKSGTVTSFLRWHKSKPNFSALADHGKSPSIGKKPRKGMSKRELKNVQDVILNSNEQDCSQQTCISFLHLFSSVDQDLPSGTAPLFTLSNSPISVHYFGCSTLGQYVYNFTGPPPLVHVPSVSTSAKLPLPTTSPIQQEPRPLIQTQFWLCFVNGNISRCNGCKGQNWQDCKKHAFASSS